MALEAEAAAAALSSFLRDFPAPLGPAEPLPWGAAGSGALSKAEVPGALAERAGSLLGGRLCRACFSLLPAQSSRRPHRSALPRHSPTAILPCQACGGLTFGALDATAGAQQAIY